MHRNFNRAIISNLLCNLCVRLCGLSVKLVSNTRQYDLNAEVAGTDGEFAECREIFFLNNMA